jgi:hypothetical protein
METTSRMPSVPVDVLGGQGGFVAAIDVMNELIRGGSAAAVVASAGASAATAVAAGAGDAAALGAGTALAAAEGVVLWLGP